MTETPLLTEGRPAYGSPRVKLTAELIGIIVKAVSSGMYVTRACALAGIAETTYYEWIRRGKDESGTIYEQLAQALQKAEADDQARRLSRMEAAAEGGAVINRTIITKPDGEEIITEKLAAPAWQADGWGMERRYRKEYSQPRGDAGIVSGGTALLLFARIEFVGVEGGEELDVMEVAEIGPGEGK